MLFKYAIKQTWARENPGRKVEIPSDADALRMHILTPTEEASYVAVCLRGQKTVKIKAQKRSNGVAIGEHKRTVDTDARDLHDRGRLMLNQGCRPEELLSLRKDAIDLKRNAMRIVAGKSAAARRELRLSPESRC